MWELRRIDERLRCHGELWKMDAAFLKRLAGHHENPVANPRPEPSPKQKSAFILQAEAHLVFGAYCDKERQRLAEKAVQLEQGTLDVAKDDAWRISNEKIAERAIAMEGEAVESHQSVGEPDLLSLIGAPLMTKDSSVRSGGVGRYECARCGRQVGVRVPKGGDGSELRPYPHHTGPYSRWSTHAVRCDGHYYAALTTQDQPS